MDTDAIIVGILLLLLCNFDKSFMEQVGQIYLSDNIN